MPIETIDSAKIDPSRIETLLVDLVQINSVNPGLVPGGAGESAVGEHVASWARDHGLEVTVEPVEGSRANVICVARGLGGIDPDGARSVMLNAHLDTVGVQGYESPFACVVTEDRMTGRGVLDTKAGLATALVIAAAARQHGLRGDVVVAAVIDEEFGSSGTEALVAGGRWKTDAAVVLEPTDLVLATEHRGYVWGTITVHGIAAHGSRPDLGVDAIASAGPILSGIGELQARLAKQPTAQRMGPGSVHASLISGGTELSTYPDTCVIEIERRLCSGETPSTFEAEMHALAALVAAPATTTVVLGASRRPLHVDPTNSFVVEMVASGQRRGVALSPSAASFWTDAALLHESGIPSVVFGPGGGGIHSTSEWVDRQSLHRFADVLAEFVFSWCA